MTYVAAEECCSCRKHPVLPPTVLPHLLGQQSAAAFFKLVQYGVTIDFKHTNKDPLPKKGGTLLAVRERDKAFHLPRH